MSAPDAPFSAAIGLADTPVDTHADTHADALAAVPFPGYRKPRRAWSPRGFTAAMTASAVGLAAGTVVFVGVSARLERTPGWADATLDWLQTHAWAEDPVWIAGFAVAVAGLWLIAVALTPGRRHLLPLEPVGTAMSAYMTRRTAAQLLRHTALSSTGVLDARVRVTRRRALLHVDYHFRDADELYDELDAALEERMDTLLPSRPLRVDVYLRPA
ncbi:DUF6286 domain-containing protein [Yinghuangia soli]|uniref:DUF6286 domain-containing protein n=1 Tax=Yinghuangia soli TaxID=2908204 RepID=A0AA41PWP9_9ACTN|nr:DUF6286 domain-containing protein [Yinghuangia soli]MCF2527224.1 DUF6286 domain-containing protein [Yinghuangia soli]